MILSIELFLFCINLLHNFYAQVGHVHILRVESIKINTGGKVEQSVIT